MSQMSYEPPTPQEWAQTEVIVIKEGRIIGLRKTLSKNGVPYTQTVWFTVTQLRGLAIEETF